jgi:hypothetical protein
MMRTQKGVRGINSRRARLVAAALGLWLVCGPALAQSSSGAGSSASPAWSILRYDDQGNPIRSEEGEVPTLSAPPQGVQPQAPEPPRGRVQAPRPAAPEIPRRAVPSTDKPHEPGEILVLDADARQIEALRRLNFGILERTRMGNLGLEMLRLRIPAGLEMEEALRLIERDFPSLAVDTNDLLERSEGLAVMAGPGTGGGDFSRIVTGWGVPPDTCGAGMRIGLIDSLVDTRSSAFAGRRITYRSFIAADRTPSDDQHGAAVASILVANGAESALPQGLLPGAQIFAAGIFENRNGKDSGNLAAMLRGIEWLAAQKVSVANMSVAGNGNAVMTVALNKASEAGLSMVAAAGNKGPGAPPAWPAAHPQVIAVTAVDVDLNVYRFANRGDYIDFAAPGVNIVTITPRGMARQSGTSFAAPFITAMVAIHRAAGFAADAELLRESLRRYTHDLGGSGRDTIFGWGLVRLRPNC